MSSPAPRFISGCQSEPTQPPSRTEPKMPSSCFIVIFVSGLSLFTMMTRLFCQPT
jgi:hypothetical protein